MFGRRIPGVVLRLVLRLVLPLVLPLVLLMSVLVFTVPAAFSQDSFGNGSMATDGPKATLNVTVTAGDGSPLTVPLVVTRQGEEVVDEDITGEKSYRLSPGTYRIEVEFSGQRKDEEVSITEGTARGVLFTFPLFRVEFTALSRKGKPVAAKYLVQRRDDRVAIISGKIKKKDEGVSALYLAAGEYVAVISRGGEYYEMHFETGGLTVQHVTARFGLAVLFLKALVGDKASKAYYEMYSSAGLKVRAGSVYPEGVRVNVDPGDYELKVYRQARSDVIITRQCDLRAGKETVEEINFLGTVRLTNRGIDGRPRWGWYFVQDGSGRRVDEGIIPRGGKDVVLDPGTYTVEVFPAAYTGLGVTHQVTLSPGDMSSQETDLGGALKIQFFHRQTGASDAYYRLYSSSNSRKILEEGRLLAGEILFAAPPGSYQVHVAPNKKSRHWIKKSANVSSGGITSVKCVYP